jgi:hypothetical protein
LEAALLCSRALVGMRVAARAAWAAIADLLLLLGKL